jgi:hypothetical protein
MPCGPLPSISHRSRLARMIPPARWHAHLDMPRQKAVKRDECRRVAAVAAVRIVRSKAKNIYGKPSLELRVRKVETPANREIVVGFPHVCTASIM